MQTELKTRKTKKQVRKNKSQYCESQRGGSGKGVRASSASRNSRSSRAGSRASSGNGLNNMPGAFRILEQELEHTKFAAQFPVAPKYIPRFTITISVKDLEELKKIFNVSPILDKLIHTYIIMHANLKDLKPEKIKQDLLDANEVLKGMIQLLKKKYILIPNANAEVALQADKWCDYIQKIIYSNIEDISKIYLSQA